MYPADQFHYRVLEIRAGQTQELAATIKADGGLCVHPRAIVRTDLADNAPERRVIYEVRNGTSAGPLEIHAYDLGARGLVVVGVMRPAN